MIRRYLAPVAGLGALAIGILANQRKWVRRLARRAEDVLYFVETEQPLLALTIDDSPHPRLTPLILDLLAAQGATATFFVLGEQAREQEALLARIVAGGHELGNHLMTDEPSIRLEPAEFERQLRHTHELIARHHRPRWFRPGSGWYNRRMLQQVGRWGYRCALGSIYPYDAHVPYTALISAYILSNVFPGGIITLHDGDWERRRTLEVLAEVLPALRGRGYEVVSLSTLVDAAASG